MLLAAPGQLFLRPASLFPKAPDAFAQYAEELFVGHTANVCN
jgi:hypothetical protein